LAYGFVGFCCFVFDLDFVVRSVSGISFPRRIRVRQSQCGSRIHFLPVFSLFTN
jgi:sensor domain CHASE-containing protein